MIVLNDKKILQYDMRKIDSNNKFDRVENAEKVINDCLMELVNYVAGMHDLNITQLFDENDIKDLNSSIEYNILSTSELDRYELEFSSLSDDCNSSW